MVRKGKGVQVKISPQSKKSEHLDELI